MVQNINDGYDMTQEDAVKELEKNYKKSARILKNKDKVDEILEQVEGKLKTIPKVGEILSHAPVFIQLIKSFITKKYTKIPMGSIIAIFAALLYLVAPLDLIPDFIPAVGYLDDALVFGACMKLVDSDVLEFLKWREDNKNLIETIIE